MKPLPGRIFIALAFICITLGSAIEPQQIVTPAKHLACQNALFEGLMIPQGIVTARNVTAPKPAATDIIYYWYTDDTDSFDAQRLTSVECRMLTADYGFRVDTDPTGGTPVRDGYQTNAYPHITWPFSILYVHY